MQLQLWGMSLCWLPAFILEETHINCEKEKVLKTEKDISHSLTHTHQQLLLNVWETTVITDETNPLGASLEARNVSHQKTILLTIKSFTNSNLNNNKSTLIRTAVSLRLPHAAEWDRQSAFVLVSLRQQSWPPRCRRSQNGDCKRGRRDTAWSRLTLGAAAL